MTDLEKIDYARNPNQMGDLLIVKGVNIKHDFTVEERAILRKKLERYMKHESDQFLEINLKKFILLIKGSDEASYLHQYL